MRYKNFELFSHYKNELEVHLLWKTQKKLKEYARNKKKKKSYENNKERLQK